MLHPKGTVESLRKIAGALSGNDDKAMQKRKDDLEKKEKSFEAKKLEALSDIKYQAGQLSIFLARTEDKSKFDFVKDSNNQYRMKNDWTGDMQHHVSNMKKTFDELSEAYKDIQREKEDIESDENQ